MLRRLLTILMVVITGVISFVPQAHAQDNPPASGSGTGFVFVPFVQKTVEQSTPVPFTPPVLAMVYGPGGPVSSADANSTFCPEILDEVSAASTDGYCVGGSQYPGFFNKGSLVTGIGTQNGKVIGAVGAAQPYQLPVKDVMLNLNGIPVRASEIFGTSEGIAGFVLDLGLKGQRHEVTAASTSAAPDEGLKLFQKLQNMPDSVGIKHPLGINYLVPVYNQIVPIPTNLGARCAYAMEGQGAWPWYPVFGDMVFRGDDIRFGGFWGLNTDPMALLTVQTCMGAYRYLSWPTLFLTPEFETWRQGVLADQEIPTGHSATYTIPQWHDDELNGTWLVTYMVAAGGTVYVIIEYAAAGVVTFASSVLLVPTTILECAFEGGIENCRLKDVAAVTSTQMVAK